MSIFCIINFLNQPIGTQAKPAVASSKVGITYLSIIQLDRKTNLDRDHCCRYSRYLHWSNSTVHVLGSFLQLVPWHNEVQKVHEGETGGWILKISNIPPGVYQHLYSDPPANQRKPENGRRTAPNVPPSPRPPILETSRSWTLPPRSGLTLKSSSMMLLKVSFESCNQIP